MVVVIDCNMIITLIKSMRICRMFKIYKNEKLKSFLSIFVSSQQNAVSFNKNIDTVVAERSNHLLRHTFTSRLLLYLRNVNDRNFKKYKRVLNQKPALTAVVLNESLKLKTNDLTVTDITNAILKLKLNSKQMLNAMDVLCSSYVKDLTTEEQFYILYTFINVISNRVTHLKFYQAAIHHIQEDIKFIKKSDLLQLIFFIGLNKKSNKPTMKKCLKQLYKMEIIKELNVNELCIVCHAAFKTSTKIRNEELLDKVKETINNNLTILKDPALFVTFIKTLRHNQFQDDDILTLYSDYMYYEQPILKVCVETGIRQLKEYDKNIDKVIRMKDIKRFLWAVSYIGYDKFDSSWCRNVIVPRIIQKIKNREYKCDTESIVECILYLWMLDCKAVELFPYVLTPTSVQQIREQKSRCKYRLNLLLSAIQFEDREMYKNLNIKPQGEDYDLNYQIQNRPVLLRIHENLKLLSKTSSLNVFEINFQIPYLNIAGITGFKNNIYKAVNIEILDEYTSVKKKFCYPSGLMQLKLRMLRTMSEPVVTICQEEIQDMSDLELQNYLKEELEFV
ncbi:uncharacterized protein LOC108742040 isoform X2 [Agrilus planipennis]|uniref:Uncharacterized protein LOC108742040 isoform X2 n=1 Tax=Agrilus planipennis TaxID=224129 RepID=A0A1W4XID1_AGRPL|nr:uncharacterized protein LOC108742040 isoform X2 [Agrilus planipennis]